MTKRPNNQHLARKYSRKKHRGGNFYRQPFWLPAPSFYILAAAGATMVFFIVWGILHDGTGTPWIPAGIVAGFILGGAVILREIVLRRVRNNLLLAQEKLDYNLNNVYMQKRLPAEENKFTLEKNSTFLKEIAEKSKAAQVLGKLSEAHWEVFELCDEYLHRSEKELQTIRGGSPRIAALNHGRQKVKELHKFHLLAWSSAETRSLIQEARTSATVSNKLEIAAKALNILESAIQFYPDETRLIESENVIKEFIVSVKVTHWVEQAERAAFKGNYKRAINHYRDALFYLARENARNSERDLMAEKINFEIEKIKKLALEKEKLPPFRD